MTSKSTARIGRLAPGVAPPPSALNGMRTLLWSMMTLAPRRAALALALSIALLFTCGVSLLMLVPLLGVAGLDVGEGSVGAIAEVLAGALGAVGLAPSVPVVIAAYLLVVICGALLGRAHSVLTTRLLQTFSMSKRMQVFEAITNSRWVGFVRRPSSEFMHGLTQEIERVTGAVSGVLNLVTKLITSAIHLSLAVFVSPGTTVLVVASGGALLLLLGRKTRAARVKGEAVSVAYEAMYGAISEHLAGLRVTKSHGTESFHLQRFDGRVRDAAMAQLDLVRNRADVNFWLQLGSATIMASIFGMALVVFAMPVATILLLLYLFARLVPMLMGLQQQVQSILNLLPAVDRVEAMLASMKADADAGSSLGDRDDSSSQLVRALRFERVSFGYVGPQGNVALQGVDLEVRAGRTTAIVGPSGGGKSTVADLAVGLLTPDMGRVLVDDVPLEGGRIVAWRRRIGYVNQDTFLFNDTIRENLLLVRPEASEHDLREALRSASASFVEALPDGLDTIVGDRGVRLCGGERQRIALARAILRRPALLVLDEATSALDPENERVIQEAIANMVGKQTLLVIAHRLASVREAHDIYVMEFGRVVESGGWDDLVSRPGGRFRELCRAQGLLER